MQATAVLKNWSKVGQVIYGDIYGDTKGRFPDGTYIRTSRVMEVDEDFAYTMNSIYKLDKETEIVPASQKGLRNV